MLKADRGVWLGHASTKVEQRRANGKGPGVGNGALQNVVYKSVKSVSGKFEHGSTNARNSFPL